MRIKKYEAPSLPEALAKIKHEMGETAVILKTRFNTGNSSKSKLRKTVEVTAAIDTTAETTPIVPPLPAPEEIKTRSRIKRSTKQIDADPATLAEKKPAPAPVRQTPSEILSDIKTELAELKEKVAGAQGQSLFGQPAGIQIEIARKLAEKGVPETLAVEIVKKLSPEAGFNDIAAAWKEVKKQLVALLRPGDPIKVFDDKATVVLLMGPTGSGKTSAAARLAFHYNVDQNVPVTLFSTDTFRADSREQLRSLADMIGCPSLSISSPEHMAVALRSYRRGLIIIDTSGVSSSRDLAELMPIIGAANPQETHLVVPADMPARDILGITKTQPDLQIDKIIVTKLDQSKCRGGVLGAAREGGIRFSYQCSSREIPGRFDLFEPETFISSLLPEPEGNLSSGDAFEVVGW